MELRDSTFTSNRGGGVVRVEGGTATLTRLTFRDNTGGSNALIPGADMHCFSNADVTISECRFSNSRGGTGDAQHSGALMIQRDSTCRVLDSTFEDAYSEGDGGSVAVTVGSNAEFIRTTFRRSEAVGMGGIAAIKDDSTALFQQCELSEGVASKAGGIFITEGSVVNVTRCTLAYNPRRSGRHRRLRRRVHPRQRVRAQPGRRASG